MRLLIDGYNLMHATDLFGAGELAGTLRGSREALVAFLAERLPAKERHETVLVFDAKDAPPGLADRYEHDGIDVRFARDYPDADSMIESLLEGQHRAKHLTVVSGDRRVQRAARSSGAAWIDSDVWFRELCQRPVDPSRPAEGGRPPGDSGANADWIEEFSDPAALAAIEEQAAAAPPPQPLPPEPAPRTKAPEPAPPSDKGSKPRRKKRRPPLSDAGDKPAGRFGEGLTNPFPPGYADDLLDAGRDSDGKTGRSDRPLD